MGDVCPESYINKEELERPRRNSNNSKNKLKPKGTKQKPHPGKQPREVTQTGQNLSWETSASYGESFPLNSGVFLAILSKNSAQEIVVRLHLAHLTLSRHQVKQISLPLFLGTHGSLWLKTSTFFHPALAPTLGQNLLTAPRVASA